jgi:hypothetical protein
MSASPGNTLTCPNGDSGPVTSTTHRHRAPPSGVSTSMPDGAPLQSPDVVVVVGHGDTGRERPGAAERDGGQRRDAVRVLHGSSFGASGWR